MNFNNFTGIGRLVRDPEIREVNGTNVVTWTVAINRSFTKKSGERAEKTLFMDCELWGNAAQIVADRGIKGATIAVRGPIEEDNYEAKDGTKRRSIKLRVEFFQFGEGAVVPNREPVEPETAAVAGGDDDFDDVPF